jgi:hypothetical protein
LGVFVDTYDNNNDNKHPYLSAYWNDGTVAWDHDNDGGDHAKLGCRIKPVFRNKGAIQVVVSYFVDKIQIILFDEASEKWYDCLNMTLPKNVDTSLQYFGFSASTGAVADYHDILSFEVYDMKKMSEVCLFKAFNTISVSSWLTTSSSRRALSMNMSILECSPQGRTIHPFSGPYFRRFSGLEDLFL